MRSYECLKIDSSDIWERIIIDDENVYNYNICIILTNVVCPWMHVTTTKADFWSGTVQNSMLYSNILMFTGSSVSQVSRETKLSLSYLVSVQLEIPNSSNWAYSYNWGKNIYRLRLQIIKAPLAIIIISYGSHYKLSRKLLSADDLLLWQPLIDTLSVQSKLCVWKLVVGLGTDFCWAGHFSFILRAASDTLPTAVNLQWWHIQCDAKCSLALRMCPTHYSSYFKQLSSCLVTRPLYILT